MQKWEYMALSIYAEKSAWVFEYNGRKHPESDRTRIMTEMGREGWELVSAIPFESYTQAIHPGTYTSSYLLFFKRPIG